MAWRQKLTDAMVDILRFFVRGILIFNVIAIALFSAVFTVKFLWFSFRFLNRTLFDTPW